MERLVHRIRREGPVPFHVFMDEALYGPAGFYTTGGGAGRRRDFVTSPEVGPLFGAVLARALDAWWDSLGRPDPFVVVECGAGTGALAAGVLGARPTCAPALRYVLVDSSASMRAAQQRRRLPWSVPSQVLGPFVAAGDGDEHVEGIDDHVAARGQGPLCASIDAMPEVRVHVIMANELLDNLPFDVVQRSAAGWLEVRIGHDGRAFTEVLVPADPATAATADRLVPDASVGVCIPLQRAAIAWVRDALGRIGKGRLVIVDYAGTTSELGRRGRGWLRTFRDQQRAGGPLDEPGSADITADVAIDQLALAAAPTGVRTQADFLRAHGIDVLVAEGRAAWAERAHVGDLAALAQRSRATEAAALLDPSGLGGFTVVEWEHR